MTMTKLPNKLFVNTENKNVNTLKNKKLKWIQIRVNEDMKNRIIQQSKEAGYTNLSKYIVDVLINTKNVNTNVNTFEKNVLTLKEGLLEFNTLMEFNQNSLKLPKNFNSNKIKEAIKKCR